MTSSAHLSFTPIFLLFAMAAKFPPAVAAGEPAFPAVAPESQGVDAAKLQELADVVRTYVDDDAIVGAELLVIKNRKTILHEAFGWKDREAKIRMERETVFNIRSMTKPVTGTAAQMLVDEGRLSLDDPVARYLPAFAGEKTAAITVEHVLTHRSGLPMLLLAGDGTTSAVSQNPLYDYSSLEEVASLGGGHDLDFTPGAAFQYSDAGSEVVGALVEKAAGTSLDRFVQRRMLDPLGMHDTIALFQDDDPRQNRVCSAYMSQKDAWIRYWRPGDKPIYPYALGSQSLYCTPTDYARFLAFWMDGGQVDGKRLLSPEAVTRALTPVSDVDYPTGFSGLTVRYGQMWMLYMDADAGAQAKPVVFGHGGSDGTGAWAWPEPDLMVLYFTQSRGTMTVLNIEHEIDRLLIHPEKMTPTVVDGRKYDAFVGSYVTLYHSLPNEEFSVLVQNNRLALRMPQGLVLELLDPDADGIWRFAARATHGVSFERDADGKVTKMWLHDPLTMRRKPAEDADASERPSEDVPENLRPYVGSYLLQINIFQKKEFAIIVEGRRLALRDPDGDILKLRSKDDRDRWPLVGFPQEYVDFEYDDAGKVTAMRLHQAHEMVPGVLPPERELTLADVRNYVGTYHDPEGGVDVEVVFEGGRLMIRSPLSMVPFDLKPPDGDGRWVLKLNPAVAVRFNVDDKGNVTSYTAITPSGELERPRVRKADNDEKP